MRIVARVEAARERHRSIDAIFSMFDRDADVIGGIMAGALAYRLFIWLLPLALVLVAGLGIGADAAGTSPEDAAQSMGLAQLTSSSINNAAESPNRWYAIIVGIPILIWVTRGLLRALIGAHRLVWGEVRERAPKPTVMATLRLLGLLLCIPIVALFATAVRSWSPGPGLAATLVAAVPYAGIWLLVSLRLPHRDARWVHLIPGALAFGLAVEILHVVAEYLIAPYVVSKQGTYGALGVAAALLFSLFVFSRVIVYSAVINTILWERRTTAPGSARRPSDVMARLLRRSG